MQSEEAPLSPFFAGLAEVERLLHADPSSSMREAVALASRLVDDLRARKDATPEGRDLLVAILTAKGHAERCTAAPSVAVRTYREALELLPEVDTDPRSRNRRANLLTCRGLALLDTREKTLLSDALECFDASISVREVPDADDAERWGLSAAWLNRADVLAALGGRDRLREAVAATERARAILQVLGPETHPPYRSRLALASMKAGEFLTRLCKECGEPVEAGAIGHHLKAVEVLRPGAEAGIEESRRMLAVALCNLSRARLLLEKSGSRDGEDHARECLAWLGDAELSSPETLHLGLTARISAACHHESASVDEDRFLELTDLAEEALAAAAQGRRKFGADAVGPGLLGELARLGAHAYLIASPGCLTDFLLDLLDPERSENHFADVAEVHEAAVRVLWLGIADIQRAGFSDSGSGDYERRRERLVAWQMCRERLAAIRDRYFTVSTTPRPETDSNLTSPPTAGGDCDRPR